MALCTVRPLCPQLLDRDRTAAVSRSISLQQRLDALRNRNSQLKQKVQQLEKRLARHADDAEKLDKLTMELAVVQNRLTRSPRRDSPTRGLQSYMRSHEVRGRLPCDRALRVQGQCVTATTCVHPAQPDRALEVAVLEERNEELEHRLAA